MIFAKTKLKRIPESCKECKFSEIRYSEWRECVLMNNLSCPKERSTNGNMKYTKMKNCPLIEFQDD